MNEQVFREENNTNTPKADILIACVISLFSVFLIYPFSVLQFDPHHTGLVFQMAHEVASGRDMFTEVFNQYGILPVLIQAAFIKIFGDSVRSVILATVTFYGIAFFFYYMSFYRLIGRFLTVVSSVILLLTAPFYYMTFHPWSSVFSLAFTMSMMFCFEEYYFSGKKLYWFLSAVSTLFILLSRQPVGIVMFLSFIVIAVSLFITKDSKINIPDWVLWYSSIIIMLIIYVLILYILYGKDSIQCYYIQTVAWPFFWSNSKGGIDVLLSKLFPHNLFTIIPIVCLLNYFIYLLKMLKNKHKPDNVILMCFCVFSVASWAQFYPVPCLNHIYWSIFPMFGVFCRIYRNLIRRLVLCYFKKKQGKTNRQRKHRLSTVYVFITAILFSYTFASTVLYNILRGANELINSHEIIVNDEGYGFLNGMRLSSKDIKSYTNLQKTIKELQEKTGHPVYNLSNDAYFSTFSDNPEEPPFVFRGYEDSIYEDFYNQEKHYINKYHPIIIKYSHSERSNNYWMDNYKRYDILKLNTRIDGVDCTDTVEIYIYDEKN